MNRFDDPFDLLVACRPADLDGQAPEAAAQTTAAETVLAAIFAAPPTGERLAPVVPFRRRRRVLLASGAVVPLLLLAGWAVLHREKATMVTTVRCHATAEVTDDQGMEVLPEHQTATQACAEMWHLIADGPAPPLIGCVAADGRADVYPGGAAVCQRLGRPVLDEVVTPSQSADLALAEALSDEFSKHPCVTATDGLALAERLIVDTHAAGWTASIDDSEHHPKTACYQAMVDEANHHLLLVWVGGSMPVPGTSTTP